MEYLPQTGTKTIEFTPAKTGNIAFGCTMWMTTRGAGFEVVENTAGIKAAASSASSSADQDSGDSGSGSAACDPRFADCNVQKFGMEITKERGFYPNVFTVRKNVPVELEIDTKIQMGGCMSAMVIPEYSIAHKLTVGRTVLRFTPTRTGTIFGTCSMGSRMVTFNVVN